MAITNTMSLNGGPQMYPPDPFEARALADGDIAMFLKSQRDILPIHEAGHQFGAIDFVDGFKGLRRHHIVRILRKYNIQHEENWPKEDPTRSGMPNLLQTIQNAWHTGKLPRVGPREGTMPEQMRLTIAAQDAKIAEQSEVIAEQSRKIDMLLEKLGETMDIVKAATDRIAATPATEPPAALSMGMVFKRARELGIDVAGKKRPEIEAEIHLKETERGQKADEAGQAQADQA